MTMKVITVETPPGTLTQVFAEETTAIRVPGGTAVASSLQVGDMICLCPDGSHTVKISLIEDAS